MKRDQYGWVDAWHVPFPVPEDVQPHPGMVVVMPYDLKFMRCPTMTVEEVNIAARTVIVRHSDGTISPPLSWPRRFQRIRPPKNWIDDVERAE